MKTALARRLDQLETIVFPVTAVPTTTTERPPVAFALRLLDETDAAVRARAVRHRAITEDTLLRIIDLYETDRT